MHAAWLGCGINYFAASGGGDLPACQAQLRKIFQHIQGAPTPQAGKDVLASAAKQPGLGL